MKWCTNHYLVLRGLTFYIKWLKWGVPHFLLVNNVGMLREKAFNTGRRGGGKHLGGG